VSTLGGKLINLYTEQVLKGSVKLLKVHPTPNKTHTHTHTASRQTVHIVCVKTENSAYKYLLPPRIFNRKEQYIE